MKIKVKTWEEILNTEGVSLDEYGDLIKENEGTFCRGEMQDDLCGKIVNVIADSIPYFAYTHLDSEMLWGIAPFAVKEVLED